MCELERTAFSEWERGNLREAFLSFRQSAQLGASRSMWALGYFYDEGIGTSVSKSSAMYWYRRSFNLGCVPTATNIAILYRDRKGYRLAFRWFKLAAAKGDGDAELEVAKLYLSGRGTQRSRQRAVVHLRRASRSSDIILASLEEAHSLLSGRAVT